MQTKQIKKNKNYEYVDPSVVIDLVCGMELDSENIKTSADYNGQTYYFCAVHCKSHFTADPVKYVGE
ncbi:MAG: YHS domain-containing protein [bacterium]|nr:YHS domain-containing protein [bacterium]